MHLEMKRIFVLGDSISLHYGPYLQQDVEGKFLYDRKGGSEAAAVGQQELDFPTHHATINGGDSSMCLEFLNQHLGSNPSPSIDTADYVLLNCGLHDIKINAGTKSQQVSLDQYEQNLKEMVHLFHDDEKRRSTKPKLIWIRTTPIDEQLHNQLQPRFHRFQADLERYQQSADNVMKEHNVPMIDLYSFTLNLQKSGHPKNELWQDHVHFHPLVREKQAAFIAGFLDCLSSSEK